MPLDDPVDGLDVAEAARTLLDVRFEVEGRVVVFGVARGLLLALRLKKGGGAPKSFWGENGPELLEQNLRAKNAAGIEEIGHHRLIRLGLLKAFIERANALGGFEADIPEKLKEVGQLGLLDGALSVSRAP